MRVGVGTALPMDVKAFCLFRLPAVVSPGDACVVGLDAFKFDLQAKVVRAVGIDQGLIEADLAIPEQAEQDVVERLAPFLDALLHGFLQRIYFCLLDEILDARCIQQDFQRGNALPVQGGDQAL